MVNYRAAVSQGQFTITNSQRGLLIHKVGIDRLKDELKQVIFSPPSSLTFSSVTLRNRIQKFSEQFVADAETELDTYFNFSTGRALDVAYPDLLYFGSGSTEYYFNKSVAAAIGEGMAGYLVQKVFGFIPKSRPLGLSPDIIMESKPTDQIAFVEAKAALKNPRSTILGEVRKAAVELLHFLATAPYLKQAKYQGYIVGTEIVTQREFNCYILRMEQ